MIERTVVAGRPDFRPLRPLLAASWMLTASLLFGLMGLSAKLAMRSLPFFEVAAGRAIFGALFIFVWARGSGTSLRVRDRWGSWARTILGTLTMVCSFLTLSLLPIGDATTLANLMPLLLAFVSPFLLKERLARGLYMSGTIGFVGVALLAGVQVFGPSASLRVMGVVAGIAGALLACLAMVQLRRLGPDESAAGVSLHFLAWAGAAFGAASLVGRIHASGAMPSLATWGWLAAAGACGAAAQVAMTRAYGLDQAARVSAIGYSGVVFAHALGLFLGELPSLLQLVGAALVIASGVWVVLGSRPVNSP